MTTGGRFWWWISITASFCGLTTFVLYNVFNGVEEPHEKHDFSKVLHCQWTDKDPAIFNLRTKLGVNYEAGHWFHIAENFMVQHSILRRKHYLTNSSIVYYNFDKAGFEDHLNGVTRFLIYLGTIAENSATSALFFFSLPKKHRIQAQLNALERGSTILIPQSFLTKSQRVDLTQQAEVTGRFRPHDTTEAGQLQQGDSSKAGGVCMKMLGSIGGQWPTPQRGHWFPNSGDIESFRKKIRAACPLSEEELRRNKKSKKFKLVLYQRDISRKLENEAETLKMLSTKLPPNDWDIQVLMHSSGRSPCVLAQTLHDTDVLLTPHGFQSMLLLFLPRPAILFEVFPFKYFKRGYGPFSQEYGVVHSGVMSPPTSWHTKFFLSQIKTTTCMASKFCRGYARDADVKLTAHGVNRLVGLIHHFYYTGHQHIHEPNGSALSLTEVTLAAEKHIFTSGNFRTISTRDFIY